MLVPAKCVTAVNVRSLLAGSVMGFDALRQQGGLSEEVRGIAWHCVFFDEVSAFPPYSTLVIADASHGSTLLEQGLPDLQVGAIDATSSFSHAAQHLQLEAKHLACTGLAVCRSLNVHSV